MRGNVLAGLPDARQTEQFETLLHQGSLRIERIVSCGQATAEGHWYDQDHDEWIVVLSGGARLRIDNETDLLQLGVGDWLHLPAHCRHRVDWTEPHRETVWLALHWNREKEA